MDTLKLIEKAKYEDQKYRNQLAAQKYNHNLSTITLGATIPITSHIGTYQAGTTERPLPNPEETLEYYKAITESAD